MSIHIVQDRVHDHLFRVLTARSDRCLDIYEHAEHGTAIMPQRREYNDQARARMMILR